MTYYVVIAKDKFARGLDMPGVPWKGWKETDGYPTYDWHCEPGSPGNTARLTSCYELASVEEMERRRCRTDAHMMTSILSRDGVPLKRQPRFKKAGLPWVLAQGFTLEVDVLVVDVDNPDHAPWTSALLREFEKKLDDLEVLQTVGYYTTNHGARLLQPLDEPISVVEVEAYMIGWLKELTDAGMNPDWSCKDWTRHMRLPRVRRAGVQVEPVLSSLSRLQPRVVKPIHIEPNANVAAVRRRRINAKVIGRCALAVPEIWYERVEVLGDALATVDKGGHAISLSLAGALLERGVAPEAVPAIVAAASARAQWKAPSADHYRKNAEDTVSKWARGLAVRSDIPLWLVPIMDRITGSISVSTGASLAEEQQRLKQAIAEGPDGLTVIRAPCGIGKSHIARDVAVDRAAAGKKTVISCPTNELAEQNIAYLRGLGVKVARYYGPTSLRGEHDGWACAYRETAVALTHGLQSIPWELCEGRKKDPCPYKDGCKAKDGIDGETDALVVIGNHGLMGELDGVTGKRGLLILDEPPPVMEEATITADGIIEAEGQIRGGHFDEEAARLMRPALVLALAFLEQGSVDEAVNLAEVEVECPELGELLEAADADTVADAARGAIAPPQRAPKANRMSLVLCRRDKDRAGRLGRASLIMTVLHRALTDESVRCTVVQPRPREPGGPKPPKQIVVLAMRRQLHDAIRRDGRVVVMAADANLYLDEYRRVVCYEPAYVEVGAPDGCQVRRVLIEVKNATRSNWTKKKPPPLNMIDRALEFASAAGRRIAFVVFECLEAWTKKVTTAWASANDSVVEVAHYGALRGLDKWKEFDALVTLGDPRIDIGHVGRATPDADPFQRTNDLARAELEQAHGRLRVVHRTTPCTMIHVGRLVPFGWPPKFEIHEVVERCDEPDLAGLIARAGGMRAASRACDVTLSTVQRWLRRQSRPPTEAVALLRDAAEEGGTWSVGASLGTAALRTTKAK